MTLLSLKFTFPDWKGELEKAEQEINLFTAAQIQFNRGMLFDSGGTYNGRPGWAPLKFRNGKPLLDRGTLRKSIGPMNSNGAPGPNGVVRFESAAIIIGTTLSYARRMNDGTSKMPGGRMVAEKGKAIIIKLPSGKNATDAAKDASKNEGFKNAARRVRDLKNKIDNAQTQKAEDQYRAQLKAAEEKLAKGNVKAGRILYAQSVTIPARPFDDWNEADQEELNDALVHKIAEVLRR